MRSAWQTCLQLAGLMYSCEEGKAILDRFLFQIRGIGHFPSLEARREEGPPICFNMSCSNSQSMEIRWN